MSLPNHPVTRPHWPGQGTMGHKVETGPERLRDHIPRPHTHKMITDQIRSTVYLIDPKRPNRSPISTQPRSRRVPQCRHALRTVDAGSAPGVGFAAQASGRASINEGANGE